MKGGLARWLVAAMVLSGTLLAQDDDNSPGRGVARVSLMNGDVSVRRGDSGDWVAAGINAPLLVDDRVATAAGARAEVQLDYYNRIRLASDSEIRLTQLDDRRYQIQVGRGTVTFAAIKGSDAQVEVSTPGASLRPMAQGEYRITVYTDGSADMTVRQGQAEIYSPSGSERLRSGNTMRVRLGEGNTSEFQLMSAIPQDDWDEFNIGRDRELERSSQVYQYVSRDIYGAEDLYGQGDWNYIAPYGYCWQPYAAADWAPYRNGRWAWVDWYGWTWVSYDPWGWAPYHYGRWFYAGNRWSWYPGGMYGARHHWSPALVGWIGWDSWGGFNAGVGFGWGAVGWVPLAPFEPIHRWWGPGFYRDYRGGDFHNRMMFDRNVNVMNSFRNARVERGVTVVNGHDFSRGYVGRPLQVGRDDMSRANMSRGALPVAPSRESLRMSARENARSFESRSSAFQNDRFFSRQQASRVDRVPFDQQRSTMERMTPRSSENAMRNSTPSRSGGDESRSGWRRSEESTRSSDTSRNAESSRPIDSSNRTTNSSRGAENSRSRDTGWRHFGDPSTSSATTRSTGQDNSRTSESVRSSESNSGWRSFGSPSNSSSSSRSEQGRWSTAGGRSEGSTAGSSGRTEPSRNSGGNSGRSWSTRGAESRQQEARPSTGGGSRGDSGRSTERQSAPSRGRGNDFSDSGGYSSMQMSTPRSGGNYGGGSYEGRSASPSYGSRSYEGRSSSPSFGGGSSMSRSSSPNFGGGSSMSRSSSPNFSAPSSSGMGSRSSGGGFSGGRSGGSFGGGGGHSGGGGGGGRGGRGR